jgi:hypothetical protein
LDAFHFGRIFFIQIAVSHDFWVAEQGIGVKVELGVKAITLPLLSRFSGLISTSEDSVSM